MTPRLREETANMLHDVWLAEEHRAAEHDTGVLLDDLYEAAPEHREQIAELEQAVTAACLLLAEAAFTKGLEFAHNPHKLLCES